MDTAKYANGNRRRVRLTKAIVVVSAVVYAAVPFTVAADVQATGGPAMARAAGAYQKAPADQAVSEETVAPATAAGSRRQAAQMQRQLDLSPAALPERALLAMLGELLFASGSADLSPGAMGELNKLVDFLGRYPNRSVAIRGYTDGVGNEAYNQKLSERRANSAKAYLVARGIDSTRLSSSGMGGSVPLAANDSTAGRQQNRRVEVAITNPPGASPHLDRTVQAFVLLVLLESTRGSLGTFSR